MKEILALLTVLELDLKTKKWAEETLPLKRKMPATKNLLYFWRIKNYGLAYHRLNGEKKKILVLTSTLTGVYSLFFIRTLLSREKVLAMPIAISLGGALGNLVERWKKGYVTDFLYIKIGKNSPIFNIADAALLFGATYAAILNIIKGTKM